MRGKKVSHYEYRVKNKLVDKVIRNRNILELKINVLESGLLWGITDIDVAEKLAKKEKITVEELKENMVNKYLQNQTQQFKNIRKIRENVLIIW